MDIRPRVLILDEDPLSLELYSRELSRDYDVIQSETIAETRRCLRDTAPFIIVMEPAVSQDEGWDLLREIQASPNPPLIILCTTEDDRRAGFRQGAYAYLVKPVLPTTLRELIDQIAAKKPSYEPPERGS